MLVRQYNQETDLESASAIIRNYSSMYGAPIDHDVYINGLKSTENSMCISIFDGDELFGVARQHWWPGLPMWSIGSMFFKDSYNNQRVLNAGKDLFNFMAARAEEADRYGFFYIVRDSGSLRKDMSFRTNPEMPERYVIVDVEVIPPFQHPTNKAFSVMLSNLSGLNTKTLVARQGFLKPEYRRDLWKKK